MDLVNNFLEEINNNFIWGIPMIVFILSVGVILSFRTGFFQIRYFFLSLKQTLGSLFNGKKEKSRKKGSLSQLQVISTALAATIGTGNIAGVATAITLGGAGSVFWMWISALFGMATAYAENLLSIYYRQKNQQGEYFGGAMLFILKGLESKRFLKHIRKPLAFSFSLFCVFASLGMGNMTQINTVSSIFENGIMGLKISPTTTGITLTIIIGLIILGGAEKISRINEKFVPAVTLLYVLGTFAIILLNIENLLSSVSLVFSSAFGFKQATGGIGGYLLKRSIEIGVRRGIFSNEAGLGSSSIIGAASETKEPVIQGMWGIFTVFFDTILGCSLTAFAILTSGVMEAFPTLTGAPLVSAAFGTVLGPLAKEIISIFTVFFAFSTALGWSFYGLRAAEYILGNKYLWVYKAVFILVILPGSVLELNTVWLISDTFNGLMAIPNLIGVLALSSTVVLVTNNYLNRTLRGKDYTPPLYSAYPEMQRFEEENLN